MLVLIFQAVAQAHSVVEKNLQQQQFLVLQIVQIHPLQTPNHIMFIILLLLIIN